MKRRWPLLLLLSCWLLILLVPPLRQMFVVQLRGDGYYRGWAYGPMPSLDNQFDARKLDVENISDVRVLAVVAAEQTNAVPALDALIEKHPQQAWLLAYRLRLSVSKMQIDRMGGELSDSKRAQNQAAKIPSPERLKTKPNFTPAELEKSIALARRGQKLEPDNGFWDSMLVYFLMAGWRDEEAFRVLQKASRKPQFHEHQNEWFKARQAAREAYYHAPQPPEATLLFQFSDGLGISARQREMARIITWQGVKFQRRGQHQKSLQILTDYARLNYTAKRNAYSLIDSFVYTALAAIALSHVGERDIIAPKRIRDEKALHEKRALLTAKQVQAYTRAHGQAALGDEMAALAIQEGKRSDQLRYAFEEQNIYNELDVRPVIWSVSFYWAAALLLLLLPMLAFWWLLVGGALRWANVPIVKPVVSDVKRGVFVATGWTALLWTLAFALGVGWSLALGLFFMESDLSFAAGVACLVFGLLWPIPCAAWIVKRHARKRQDEGQDVVVRGARAKVLASWGRFRLVSFLQISGLYLLALAAAFWWLCAMAAQDQMSWLSTFELDSAITLPDALNNSASAFPLWPQLVFALALALLWLRELFASDKSRAAYQLRCWHAVLSYLITTASVSYLLLLIFLLPLRASADLAVKQYIQRGAVASMLQNYGALSKPR
jgi:hypothetical protein